MRNLSATEKSIVRRIVDYHEKGILSSYASIIDHLLKDKDIALDFQNRSAELRADIRNFHQGQLIEVVEEITVELVTSVNLLNDLEKNGYIVTLLEAKVEGQHRYGQLIKDNKYIAYEFVDQQFIELLLDYSLKSIIVSQSLLNFIENGFQTNEEKSNKISLKIAVIALVISAVLNVISILCSYKQVQYAKQQLEQATKVDDNQINRIVSDLKQLTDTVKASKTEIISNMNKAEIIRTYSAVKKKSNL